MSDELRPVVSDEIMKEWHGSDDVVKEELLDEVEETQNEEHEEEQKDETEETQEENENDTNEEEKTEEKPNEEFEEIVYRGEIMKLTKEEVKRLAQQGFDYTRKTQEIAPFRKAAEAMIRDPKLKKMVFDYISGNNQEEEPEDDTIVDSKDVKRVMKNEIEYVNSQIENIRLNNLERDQEALDDKLKSELSKEEYEALADYIKVWSDSVSDEEVARVTKSDLTTYENFLYNGINYIKSRNKSVKEPGHQAVQNQRPSKPIKNHIEKPNSGNSTFITNKGKEITADSLWDLSPQELKKFYENPTKYLKKI